MLRPSAGETLRERVVGWGCLWASGMCLVTCRSCTMHGSFPGLRTLTKALFRQVVGHYYVQLKRQPKIEGESRGAVHSGKTACVIS